MPRITPRPYEHEYQMQKASMRPGRYAPDNLAIKRRACCRLTLQ